MIKYLCIIVSTLFALLLEFFLARWIPLGFWFPVFISVFFYWLWSLDVNPRLWTALAVGVMGDFISPFPFGSFTALFFFESIIVVFLQSFFSNSKSFLAKGLGINIMILFSFLLFFPISALLKGSSFSKILELGSITANVIIVWVFWSVFFPIMFLGLLKILYHNSD